MKRFLLAELILVLLVISCGPPKIDASSDEALKKSVEKVKASLDSQDREKFDNAILALAFSDMDMSDLILLGKNPDAGIQKIKDKINGKSGPEIIEAGNKIILERLKKQLEILKKQNEQVLGEIDELNEKRERSEQARQKLSSFKIERSRFYFGSSGFLELPVIELSVWNGTSQAVSRAYFQGVLATPGRSVPWVQEDFNYEIRGGIEPRESATWNLNPNMFSEWGNAPKDRSDMVLTVTVIRLDGPDGKPILDAREFSEHDQKRLDQLQVQIKEMESQKKEIEQEIADITQ